MKIELTETELVMILDCIGNRIEDLENCASFGDAHLVADEMQALAELDMDLRETFRDDGWDSAIDAEINAETQMFNAGVKAREQQKATSRAATRREQRQAQDE